MLAPIKTAPQQIALKLSGFEKEREAIPSLPAARVVKARKVGALSKIEESPPVSQKYFQD